MYNPKTFKKYYFYILQKNFCSLYCFALKHRTFFVVLSSKMRLHSTRLISIQTENIRLPSIILVCHHSQHPAREIQPDAKNVYFVSIDSIMTQLTDLIDLEDLLPMMQHFFSSPTPTDELNIKTPHHEIFSRAIVTVRF